MSIAFDNPYPTRAEIEPVALDVIRRRGAEVLSTARRYAASAEDAEDAYQRALEILLTKAPSVDEAELVPWLKVVVKHEAFALRKARARDVPAEHGALDSLPGDAGDADERAERLDRLRVGAEALQRLKPQETRCMVLLAQGYSYAQIQELTGFSYTKVNRCLSEGRRAFVARVEGIESGAECERLAPLLSALADGEATAADMAALRPHLRGCTACRATLRDFRAAPRQVAAVLGPLGVVAAGGDAASEAAAGGVHALTTWLGERLGIALLRFQSLFEVASTQKTVAVAASTVAVAGGGVAAMHQAEQRPASAPKAHAATAPAAKRTVAPARKRPAAAAAKRTPSATSTASRRRARREQGRQRATSRYAAATTTQSQVTPLANATPAPPPPPTRPTRSKPGRAKRTPAAKPDPPAEAGGEFGP